MKQLLKLEPSVFSKDLCYESLYSLSCALMSQTYVTRLSSDLEIMLSPETTTKGNNYCDPGNLLQFLLFSMTALHQRDKTLTAFHQWYQYLLQYLFYLKSQCIFPFNCFSCDVHSPAGSRVMNISPLSTSLYTISYVINPKVQSVFRDFPNASENYRPMPAHYMSVRRDTEQASIYPNIIFANFGVF